VVGGEDEDGVWRGRRSLCEWRTSGDNDGGRVVRRMVVVVERERDREREREREREGRNDCGCSDTERREEGINKNTPHFHLKFQLCH